MAERDLTTALFGVYTTEIVLIALLNGDEFEELRLGLIYGYKRK